MSDQRPRVLCVCVENGGKSQMAAGLMRHRGGDTVQVPSAGTRPRTTLKEMSVASLAEIGVDLTGERPKPIRDDDVRAADLVVTLGREAQVEPVPGTRFENWDTDEPSERGIDERGIDGLDRMRLVRDHIDRRVQDLLTRLVPGSAS